MQTKKPLKSIRPPPFVVFLNIPRIVYRNMRSIRIKWWNIHLLQLVFKYFSHINLKSWSSWKHMFIKQNKMWIKSLEFRWVTQFSHKLYVSLIHKINEEIFFWTENPWIDIHFKELNSKWEIIYKTITLPWKQIDHRLSSLF